MYMKANTKAALIKERVSMPDVIARYHHPGRRDGRTTCPFHGGEHDNLGYDRRVYHCFVCGAKGDVIDFVRRMTGTDFAGALAVLDADFRLGLENYTNGQRIAAEIVQRERESERAKERAHRAEMHKIFVLFTRIMRWIRTREVQTQVHASMLAWLDRQTDFIMGGGDYTSDPKAAARAAVQRVRAAEKEAAHAG